LLAVGACCSSCAGVIVCGGAVGSGDASTVLVCGDDGEGCVDDGVTST